MADYKVIDAEQLDSDLTIVADAIRSKSGTTEEMAFPSEFKSVVERIDTSKEEQEKSVDITENGTTEVIPDEGKVLSKVTVNVDVQSGEDSATDYIEQMIDESGVLDSTDGTIAEKIEQMIQFLEGSNLITSAKFGKNGPGAERIVFNCISVTDFYRGFYNCNGLKEIYLTNTQNVVNWQQTFYESGGIQTIETLDMSSADKDIIGSQNHAWINSPNLANIKFVPRTIKNTITFQWCPKLTDESIQSIADGLAIVETTQTLILHADVKAKLTDTQIATITGKNWTIA